MLAEASAHRLVYRNAWVGRRLLIYVHYVCARCIVRAMFDADNAVEREKCVQPGTDQHPSF